MPIPNISWELLERYLAEEATPFERQAVNDWLDIVEDEQIRRFFADLVRRNPAKERMYVMAWAALYLPRQIPNLEEVYRNAKSPLAPAAERLRGSHWWDRWRRGLRRGEGRSEVTWEILGRYLKGEPTTSVEARLAQEWLAAEAADSREMLAALDRGDLDAATLHAIEAEASARAERGELPILGAHRRRRRPTEDRGPSVAQRHATALRAAAAVVLVLGGFIIVWQRVGITSHPHATAPGTKISALAGGRLQWVTLTDGSDIILSPGSTLRYSAAYDKARREVELDGEAYFAVRHDADRPFLVRSGYLTTEDLGTEFVVSAYPDDPHPRVIVREGRIRLNGTDIDPGYLGRLDPDGSVAVERADTAKWFALTRDQFSFDRMHLRDALPRLNRWYNLDFRLADSSIGNIVLDGDFPRTLHDGALKKLAAVLGLSVTQTGSVVTFYPVASPPP